jgi:hypothetical protein
MAVHERPAAFEGSDGFSYSVEILAEPVDDERQWGAFILFVKWARIGAQTPEGHLETPFVGSGTSEREAIAAAGTLSLGQVKDLLDEAIAERTDVQKGPARRWYDVMRDDSESESDESPGHPAHGSDRA